MKNYTQVYVKNSIEAAKLYCKAFGAEITREFKNETNTAYEHCELLQCHKDLKLLLTPIIPIHLQTIRNVHKPY